jgi:hypothetical protein
MGQSSENKHPKIKHRNMPSHSMIDFNSNNDLPPVLNSFTQPDQADGPNEDEL